MKTLLAILIFALPAMALNDPGAGLATRAARNTARVTQWQAKYEMLNAEHKEDEARLALQDLYETSCLLNIARNRMGEPDAKANRVSEWVEDQLKVLAFGKVLGLLADRCDPPAGWPYEPDDQGKLIEKTIVIRGIPVANRIRQMLPVLPRIGNVPPLVWGTMSHQVCVIDAEDPEINPPQLYDMIMSRHPWHESHLDLLQAIATAEGHLSNFYLVDDLSELPCDSITSPEI